MDLEIVRSRRFLPALALAVATVTFASGPPAGALAGGSAAQRVNTTPEGNQVEPAVAVAPDGTSVAVWTSYGQDGDQAGIYAQRFSSAGLPVGDETLVNSTTADRQLEPDVAIDADGDFVVVWTSFEQDGSGAGVYAQLFDATGEPRSRETLVNTSTEADQDQPSVAMSLTGDFVVAWSSTGQDGDGRGVHAQAFTADGDPRGSEVGVNATTAGDQQAPSVAMDATGAYYVVAWQGPGGGTDTGDVYARRIWAGSTPFGADQQASAGSAEIEHSPDVAIGADGTVAVAWVNRAGSVGAIHARAFDQHLIGRSSDVELFWTRDVGDPAVAIDATGRASVAFAARDAVYARSIDASGTIASPLTQVGAAGTVVQALDIGLDADGDAFVAWSTFLDEGPSGYDVYGRRLRGPQPVDLAVTQDDSADPAAVGSRLTYRIRVANRNDESEATGLEVVDAAIGAATGVRAIVTPADGATFLAAAGAGWTCGTPGATLTCRLASPVRAGAFSPDLKLTFAAPGDAGPALQSVRVADAHLDPLTTNNTATEQTSIRCVVELAPATPTAQEAGVMTVTATRRGSDCGASSAGYETSSGSALAGTDFTDVAGTLEWSDAATDVTFDVPILPDSLDERNEQLKLRLTGPTGALLGARALISGTILDNDAPPRINLTTTSSTAQESGALVEVTARLSAISGQAVSVALAKAGTATHGADYFTENALTIPAGAREATFTIEVVDDAVDEPNETAVISLTSPIAATIGTQKTYRLTLTDDD